MASTFRALAPATVVFATLAAGSAHASLIWDGSASRGTGIFKLIGSNCSSPGSVTAASDSVYGTGATTSRAAATVARATASA